jgi:hypothetical protein
MIGDARMKTATLWIRFLAGSLSVLAVAMAALMPAGAQSVVLNTNDISNFTQLGLQPPAPGFGVLMLSDADVADVCGLYANDPDAAPGSDLDLTVTFQVVSGTSTSADGGFKIIINDGVTKSAIAACVILNGQRVIALAGQGPPSDPSTYPVFVQVDWTGPVTLKLRRTAVGGAEILEVNGLSFNPRIVLSPDQVAGRTRAGATVEFGCLSGEGTCTASVRQFRAEKPSIQSQAVSLAVSPANSSMPVGGTVPFHAVRTFDDASTKEVRAGVSFAPPLTLPVQVRPFREPLSVALGNLDGDAKLELVIGSDTGVSVVKPQTGNGPSYNTLAVASIGYVLAPPVVGDFNSDGALDVAAADLFGDRVALLLGTGNGSLGPPTFYPVDRAPISLAAGDFNGDGKKDLVTAGGSDNHTISVLLATGPGTFGPSTSYAVPGEALRSIAIGDVNSDGIPDLAVGAVNSTNSSLLLGTGSGTFGPPSPLSISLGDTEVILADFTGDGKLDLAFADPADFGPTFGKIRVAPGTGLGPGIGIGPFDFGATRITTFALGKRPFHLAPGDFNKDGVLDLGAVTTAEPLLGPSFGYIAVVLSPGSTNPIASLFPQTSPSVGVAVGDVDGDGGADLVVPQVTPGINQVKVVLDPLGSATSLVLPPFTNASIVVDGDFDGDGDTDMVVANSTSVAVDTLNTDTIVALPNNGAGSFGAPIHFQTGRQPIALTTGDFNEDGRLDVVSVNVLSRTISIFPGASTGFFGTRTDFAFNTGGALAVEKGDFNNDGHLDLAFPILNGELTTSFVALMFGTGTGSLAPPVQFPISNGFQAGTIAVGDLNEDGNLDLAISAENDLGFFVSMFMGNGTGSFVQTSNLPIRFRALSLVLTDVDSNGHLDLIVGHEYRNEPEASLSLMLGSGTGSFGAAVALPFGLGVQRPLEIAVRDLNGDGIVDLAVAHGGVGVLAGRGGGSFDPAVTFSNGFGVSGRDLAIADFNNDGRPDVALANGFGSDTVSLLKNTTEPLWKSSNPSVATIAQTGVATAVAAGTTSITASYGGLVASTTLTVSASANRPPLATTRNITVAAAASCSATIVASDVDNGSSDPDSGDTISLSLDQAGPFSLGAHTVTLTATDNHGVVSSSTAIVTVVDRTAPAFSFIPPGVNATTGGAGSHLAGATLGDAALGAPTAVDTCSGTVVIRTGVPAGNFFPVGVTTITYTARDSSGNAATATQTITVIDNTPPVIAPRADVTVNATMPSGATVGFALNATDNVAVVSLVCTRPSGSVFPIGTSSVQCTARDAAGNTAGASFNVRVKGASEQIADLLEFAAGTTLPPSLKKNLLAVFDAALADPHSVAVACRVLSAFIVVVRALPASAIPIATRNQMIADATRIKAVLGCP